VGHAAALLERHSGCGLYRGERPFPVDDRGGSWTRISPDLTAKIDRDTITIMGKKVGALNYSPNGTLIDDPAVTSLFGAIISIAESPLDARVLYTAATTAPFR
jgi:hypothetical protein